MTMTAETAPRVASARGRESTRLALVAKAALERQGWKVGDRLTDESRDAIGQAWEAVKGMAKTAAIRAAKPSSPWSISDAVQSLLLEFPYILVTCKKMDGRQFTSYAKLAFRNQMIHLYRRDGQLVRFPDHAMHDDKRSSGVFSLEDWKANLIPDRNSISGCSSGQDTDDQLRKILNAVDMLPERLRFPMKVRYGIADTIGEQVQFPELAAQLGVSTQRAHWLVDEAKAKVRAYMNIAAVAKGAAYKNLVDSRDAAFLARAKLMPGAPAKKIGESLGFSYGVTQRIVDRTGFTSRWMKARSKRQSQAVA